MKRLLIIFFLLSGFMAESQVLPLLNPYQFEQETPPASTLYDNVAVWFDLNDASSPLIDESANGFDATVSDMTAYQQAGHIDYAIQLDGSNDYATVSDNDSLSFVGTNVTYASWIYITDLSTYRTIASKYGEYRFFVDPNDWITYRIYGSAGSTGRRTNAFISTDTWYCVFATHTGSTSRDDIDIFVYDTSGNLIQTDAQNDGTSGGGAGYAAGSNDFLIGSTNATWLYAGYLDQLVIWRKILTEAERIEFVKSGAGGAYGSY